MTLTEFYPVTQVMKHYFPNLSTCNCTCLLCHLYDHDAVAATWWIKHAEKCPERT